jgi:hypothetical protein
MSLIAKGTWVEVERALPAAGQVISGRAPAAPLAPRVSGFLLEAAELGAQVMIRTITGKVHAGKLRIQSPSYGHSFGHTVPELLAAGRSRRIS